MSDTPADSSSTEPEEERLEEIADRPLECTECKKPIAVWYTEIVGDTTTQTVMCQGCPELQKKLKGEPGEGAEEARVGEGMGLCCGTCGTTLEGIRMGHPLGCSHCYEIFSEILLQELLTSKRVAPRVASAKKKSTPIHLGRSPGEAAKLSPSLQLIALNEALRETLCREDYEQAAWLRDQIKELTEEEVDDGQKRQ